MLNTTSSIDSIAKRTALSIENCYKNSTSPNQSYSKNEVFGSNIKEKDEQFFCEIKSPTYAIYEDADVELPAKNGNMPKELQDRLIRTTVSNIVTLAYLPPFNRKLTKQGFLEMAKFLVYVYPCLSVSEKKNVSIF